MNGSRTITFERNNILHLNGRILETDDWTPPALGSFVEEYAETLRTQLFFMQHQAVQELDRHLILKPAILLARFANLSSIGDVLTFNAIRKPTVMHSVKDLRAEYMPYWNGVKGMGFTPFTQRVHHSEPAASGIWLGLQ